MLEGRPEIALAATRALGRAGWEVGLVGSLARTRSRTSRWVTRYEHAPNVTDSLSGWGAGVEQAIRTFGPAIVLAASDAVVLGLHALPLDVPTVPALGPAVDTINDKYLLAASCGAAGVPYPETHLLDATDELDASNPHISGPTVVKARWPSEIVGDRVVLHRGAQLVDAPHAAIAAIAAIRARGGHPILQPLAPGPKLQAVIIRREGRTTLRLACLVEREFPRIGGAEATLRTVSTDHGTGRAMIESLERLVDHLGYAGLLQAEFIAGPEGPPMLIDANPRLWGSLPFSEGLGLQPTERAALDALGVPTRSSPAVRPHVRYHRVSRELASMLHRETSPRRLLASVGRHDVWDLVDLSDPGPDFGILGRGIAARGREGLASRRR